MRSLTFLSSSAYCSASWTMRSISSSDRRPFSAVMVIFSALPVPLSSALTWRMPLASTSKETSIWGTPRGAGGRPVSSNLPRMWLSLVMERSPSYTWMSTAGWLSWWVEKVWDFLVGMVVPRLISLVMTPPTVSMPCDSGVTSKSRISLVASPPSPDRIPPWTAAPNATASSGLMPLEASLPPKYSEIRDWTLGMRVDPPTRTISSISDLVTSASSRTRPTGPNVFLNRSLLSSSKRARVRVSEKSKPSARSSISNRACCWDDRARLTRSTSLRSFCRARLSPEMSWLFFFFIILMKYCMTR
mmetsp:Transcript_31021/g.90748  ORF Transcript_31021/g.90748 Transcript_31021/m.90748 type:complete len:302 (-) Transcript_31021:81-986(-)